MTRASATGADGGPGTGGAAAGRSVRARRTSSPAALIAATSTRAADPISSGEWSTVVTAGGVAGRTGTVDGAGGAVGVGVVVSRSSRGSVVGVGRPGPVVAPPRGGVVVGVGVGEGVGGEVGGLGDGVGGEVGGGLGDGVGGGVVTDGATGCSRMATGPEQAPTRPVRTISRHATDPTTRALRAPILARTGWRFRGAFAIDGSCHR
jgi:hypothetical protein